jgi:hypothetical protein
MEHLYIVLWKNSRGPWQPEQGGVFTERRLAENLMECKKAAGEPYTFAIVEGTILPPKEDKDFPF